MTVAQRKRNSKRAVDIEAGLLQEMRAYYLQVANNLVQHIDNTKTTASNRFGGFFANYDAAKAVAAKAAASDRLTDRLTACLSNICLTVG